MPTPNNHRDDFASPNAKKDKLNTSMYNISPIEVYIENRSAANTNHVFHSLQNQQQTSSTNQRINNMQKVSPSKPIVDASMNLSPGRPQGQNTLSNIPKGVDGQLALNQPAKRTSQAPHPGNLGNLNNPYLSYYKKRQESIQNKSQAVMQKNLQLNVVQQQTPKMKNAGVQKDHSGVTSPKRSNQTDVSPITEKSGYLRVEFEKHAPGLEAASRKAVSNLKLEPKYKSKDIPDAGVQSGSPLQLTSNKVQEERGDVQAQRTQSNYQNSTSYLVRQAEIQGSMELQELQEQTAEDNMSFQDGMNNQANSKVSRRSVNDQVGIGISNMSQKYIDSMMKNLSLSQAQNSKEVEKMLQYLYSKNQLSNTFEALS